MGNSKAEATGARSGPAASWEALVPVASPEQFVELEPLQAPPDVTPEQQLEMLRKMWLIRYIERAVMDLFKQNLVYGVAHSYEGSEAIAVGACAALRPTDFITSTHRGHGHVIAKGGDVRKMMAELMGKYAGYCHGKGGSMHIAAVEEGMLGATGIVGGAMAIAVGAALTAHTLRRDQVTVCFHGDGATNQGIWHESLNLASAWNLPVVFLCENNQWAISCPYDRAARNPNIQDRAAGYGIPGVTVDGYNPFAVYRATREAAERARSDGGPTLVVAKTYRYIGHFVADDQHYRDVTLAEAWRRYDPLKRMTAYLLEAGVADQTRLDNVEQSARQSVEQAIEFAKQAPEPPPETLFDGLYSCTPPGEVIAR